jgi:glycosyltransferase involved in cell wall biosynthesis
VPSLWYENFPRTLVEAFASGLPVLASRLGALQSLVDDGRTGMLVAPGDADAWALAMRQALDDAPRLAALGRAARELYEREYTAAANHRMLMAIYEAAIDERRCEAAA